MGDFRIRDGVLVMYSGNEAQIRVPGSVRSMEDNAFRYAPQLQSVRLPKHMRVLPRALDALPPDCRVMAPGVPMAAFRGHRRKLAALAGFCQAQELGIVYRESEGYWTYAARQHGAEEVWALALEYPCLRRYFLRGKRLRRSDVEGMLRKAREKEQEDPETTAELLDYLQTNFSDAGREAQADRELEELLSGALPAAEARKLWVWETAEDKTIRITSYKGTQTEVEIPRRIGQRTVTEVHLSERVYTPGKFKKAGSWKKAVYLYIPKEVRHLEIWDDYQFTQILVEEGNPRYRVEDGWLIDFVEGRLLFDLSRRETGHAGETSLVLPEGIRHIGNYAFYDCTLLQKIQLPAGLQSIGEAAFEGCTGLQGIDLPAGLQSIGSRAFCRCPGLETIHLPEGLQTLEKEVFQSCSGLRKAELPAGLKHLEARAFDSCSALEEMDLPAGLQSIGEGAFYMCRKLREIRLPQGLQSLGKSAFSCCFSLQSVVLPPALQSLDDETFRFCTRVQDMTLPEGLVSLGGRVFAECTALQRLVLPESLQRIGDAAFFGCSRLQDMTLPEGLKELGYGVFGRCCRLCVVLPKGLQELKESIFQDQETGRGEEADGHVRLIAPWLKLSALKKQENRKQALLTFLWAREQGYRYEDEENYLRFARQHRGWLGRMLLEDRELAHQVAGVPILSEENVEALLPEADVGTRAILLDYQHTYFPGAGAENDPLSLEDLAAEGEDAAPGGWMQGKIFVHTGLDALEEEKFEALVRAHGGLIKSSTVRKTDVLVFDPNYGRETVKLRRARELQLEGSGITILTLAEWKKRVEETFPKP